MSLNRFPFKTSALALAIIAAPLAQAAEREYNEPTRGFFIEHGEVARNGKASVELQTGSDGLGNGGGIRLGLPKAEVLLNSGMNDYDQNELMVKWGLPKFSNSEGQNSSVSWALLGGIAHVDSEDDDTPNNKFKQTNLKLGVTATIRADAGIFTAQPMLVYADGKYNNAEQIDDTFLELGLGAYMGLVDTEAGKFSVGVEAIITTQDNVYGSSRAKDNTFALGLKWAYNEHIHLDIVPFVHTNDELLGIPGMIRLNAAF